MDRTWARIWGAACQVSMFITQEINLQLHADKIDFIPLPPSSSRLGSSANKHHHVLGSCWTYSCNQSRCPPKRSTSFRGSIAGGHRLPPDHSALRGSRGPHTSLHAQTSVVTGVKGAGLHRHHDGGVHHACRRHQHLSALWVNRTCRGDSL